MDLLGKLQTMAADKSQNGRLRMLVLMLGGLIVGGVVLATLWVTGQAPVQGAIVGGAFTLLAAIVGVFIVLLQLRRQAENTIAGNRHNEMMKLKKDVYEEAQPVLHAAKVAQKAFHWCIKRFLIDIENVRKLPQWVPKTSMPVLSEDMQLSHDATHAAISVTEKWRIIDPRLDVIRIGLLAALTDVTAQYGAYSQFAPRYMAFEKDGAARVDAARPNAEDLITLNELTTSLSKAILTLYFYTVDFETELQNALLGELFERKLWRRRPRYAGDKVLCLDDHDALMTYFLEETEWGRTRPSLD